MDGFMRRNVSWLRLVPISTELRAEAPASAKGDPHLSEGVYI